MAEEATTEGVTILVVMEGAVLAVGVEMEAEVEEAGVKCI